MQIIPTTVLRMLNLLRARSGDTDFAQRLRGDDTSPKGRRLRMRQISDARSVADIWNRLREDCGIEPAHEQAIADEESVGKAEDYSRNIENFIGTAKVPMGLIGPLRVNGLHAEGDYFIPLATTEAALVASYGVAPMSPPRQGASVLR